MQAEKLIGRAVKELEQQLDSSHLLTLLAVPWPSSHFSSYFNGWCSAAVLVLKVLCRLVTSVEIYSTLTRSFLTSHKILTRILFRSFSSSHCRFLYPSDSRWIIWAASSRHKVDSRKLKSSSNVRCEASWMWNLQLQDVAWEVLWNIYSDCLIQMTYLGWIISMYTVQYIIY